MHGFCGKRVKYMHALIFWPPIIIKHGGGGLIGYKSAM
jgi:hypothetical protein